MAQILPRATNIGEDIGQGARQGFTESFIPAMQQQYQQHRLKEAFSKLDPKGDFIKQLKDIAPELLSTPGGAQALGELSPVLSQYAQSQATSNAIKNRRDANQSQQQGQSQQTPGMNATARGVQGPAQDKYRNPEAPKSAQTPFPERTAGPTTQPEMSPRQLEDYALDLMQQSADMGQPVPYAQAKQVALSANNDIRASNQKINQEKSDQDQAQKAITQGMVNRAVNAGLAKDPEDQTVASKLALEAKNAPNDEEAWEYVRSGMRKFNQAKEKLTRNYTTAGPITETYRKLFGSYKDKETAAKEAQPALDEFRKYGLFDEARKLLTNEVGLGAEDTEAWLFPPTKEQNQQLSMFPSNPRPKYEMKRGLEYDFPGENYKIRDPEKFQEFKGQVHEFLKKNPKANLISFRGKVNQDKGYAWQDISKAVNELIDEKQFTPDNVQDQQMLILDNAPIPGLAQQFDFLWKGTK